MLLVAEITDAANAEGLLATLRVPAREVLLVDSTGEDWPAPPGVRVHRRDPPMRVGWAGAWNIGGRITHSHLVVCHEATRFGSAGGRDLRALLDRRGDDAPGALLRTPGLVVLRHEVLRTAGLFDENLWPDGGVMLDYARRVELLGLAWGALPVELAARGRFDAVLAHEPARRYYRAKWGGPPGEERHTEPHRGQPVGWWPSPRHVSPGGRDRRVLYQPANPADVGLV